MIRNEVSWVQTRGPGLRGSDCFGPYTARIIIQESSQKDIIRALRCLLALTYPMCTAPYLPTPSEVAKVSGPQQGASGLERSLWPCTWVVLSRAHLWPPCPLER